MKEKLDKGQYTTLDQFKVSLCGVFSAREGLAPTSVDSGYAYLSAYALLRHMLSCTQSEGCVLVVCVAATLLVADTLVCHLLY